MQPVELHFSGRQRDMAIQATNPGYDGHMTQEADKLLKQTLALLEDRAALAGSLISSLDTVIGASAEGAWRDEISRRIEELDSGKAKTISWDDVQRRIAAKLKNGQLG